MNIQLTVDTIYKSQITGWAIDKKNLQERVRLILIHPNGEYEVEARTYREDLKNAGIGDGEYGFFTKLPSHVDLENDSFKICTSEGIELFVNAVKKKSSGYCDITDLITFLIHHGHPTGIQKLQLNLLLESQKNRQKDQSYFTFIINDKDIFFIIPNIFLNELISGTTNYAKIANNLFNERTNFKEVFFSNRDKLLIAGAPWGQQNYHQNVCALKNKFDLVVYQIFYDLIPIRLPEHCDANLCKAFESALNIAIACIDYFIPISEYASKDLLEYSKEIGVEINNPLPIPLANESNVHSQIQKPEIYEKLKNFKYVLFVSSVESRKNHTMMVDIWKDLLKKYGNSLPKLIFAGRRGWRVDNLFTRLESTKWLDGHIIHLEGLNDHEIAWLYKNCEFTVFPSLAEGWGLPVSESLSYGKICICSNNSAIPEAAAGVAVAIDHKDYYKWVETIDAFIANESMRELHQKKIETLKLFSWSEYTSQLLKFIERPVNSEKQINLYKKFRNNVIYRLGNSSRQMYLDHLFRMGDPNLIINPMDFFPVEENLVWSKYDKSRIKIESYSTKGKKSVAIKLTLAGWPVNDLQFQFKINAQKNTQNLVYPMLSREAWVILENIEGEHSHIDIEIELINGCDITKGKDHRNLTWGILEFAILQNRLTSPSNQLLCLLNKICI